MHFGVGICALSALGAPYKVPHSRFSGLSGLSFALPSTPSRFTTAFFCGSFYLSFLPLVLPLSEFDAGVVAA